MNILNYKMNKVDSPNRILKPNREKTRQINKLDAFVGKFQANGRINCVTLKQDFKKGVE